MVGSRGSVELAVLDSHQSAPFLRRCGLSPLNQEGGGHAQGCHDSAWRWGETWTAIGDAPFPCPLTHPHRDKSSGNRRRRSRDPAVRVLAGARLPMPFSVWPHCPRARLPSEYTASPPACQCLTCRNHEQVADPTDRPRRFPGACCSVPACWLQCASGRVGMLWFHAALTPVPATPRLERQ